jgi:glycosyltransferase involved in cell wall biosynthesis
MDSRQYDWEIIVVNDGSQDATERIVNSFCCSEPRVQILTIPHSGKGRAVKTGMLKAKGDLRFMCDADLSMPITEIDKFFIQIANGYDIVIGSRELSESKRFDEPKIRHLIGRVFNFFAKKVSLTGFNDTQCGFKCFKENAANHVFLRQASKGFAFDIEILKLAKKEKFNILEIPIIWYHKRPSKVKIHIDSIKMIKDTLLIAFRNNK